jgi:hypothetical protein
MRGRARPSLATRPTPCGEFAQRRGIAVITATIGRRHSTKRGGGACSPAASAGVSHFGVSHFRVIASGACITATGKLLTRRQNESRGGPRRSFAQPCSAGGMWPPRLSFCLRVKSLAVLPTCACNAGISPSVHLGKCGIAVQPPSWPRPGRQSNRRFSAGR